MNVGPDGRHGPHVIVGDVARPEPADEDRHHLDRVLRVRAGDPVTVGDGAGNWRRCRWGRVIEPVCFEEGKIFWLEQFIEDREIELARSYFYTDSVTDLPLLEIVGHPVVTNPDPMLYRAAIKRHWPVRFFEPPEIG